MFEDELARCIRAASVASTGGQSAEQPLQTSEFSIIMHGSRQQSSHWQPFNESARPIDLLVSRPLALNMREGSSEGSRSPHVTQSETRHCGNESQHLHRRRSRQLHPVFPECCAAKAATAQRMLRNPAGMVVLSCRTCADSLHVMRRSHILTAAWPYWVVDLHSYGAFLRLVELGSDGDGSTAVHDCAPSGDQGRSHRQLRSGRERRRLLEPGRVWLYLVGFRITGI